MKESKLLESMEEMKRIALSQGGQLTREEIGQYLSDMELDGRQLQAVYQYLGDSGIKVEGYHYIREKSQPQEQEAAQPLKKTESAGGKRATQAERNLNAYRREIARLDTCSAQEEQEMFLRFLKGETGLRNALAERQLSYVSQMAGRYGKRGRTMGVPQEELIAEGNLGLMNGMLVLEQSPESFLGEDGQADMDKIYSVIRTEVKQAMEQMIDEATAGRDWEDTILAKMNLLHEAAKYLAEELGRTATGEELAEYTRISVKEIQDIRALSEDARKTFS